MLQLKTIIFCNILTKHKIISIYIYEQFFNFIELELLYVSENNYTDANVNYTMFLRV